MQKLEIIVIGAGLYVCGKGTSGYGTILPAIFEWKRHNKKERRGRKKLSVQV